MHGNGLYNSPVEFMTPTSHADNLCVAIHTLRVPYLRRNIEKETNEAAFTELRRGLAALYA